ncbi:hypothetical protein E4U42_006941 [Claviceps africana]|uniref:Pleckstrin homology domain-containing protein n=1 Tax=Claviceps africana TaxID=83212 RepID=A0A8K0J2D5_9HYPO|nr:hypothetical protein E4U42_006941 [Claviceps africana]
MKEWETDNENMMTASEATSLANGSEYRSRTSSSRSRRSKRRSITPPVRGPSYVNMTTDRNDKRSSRDITNDESISILDPRRFTPTLHANLVSEILALRRDQDEKTRQIESLEAALHSAKEEHEFLQENLTNTSKESRSLKRQLSLLEGGTSSALGALARERDEAVDSVADTKKRLEAAQKTIRSQQHDSQRVHDLWAREKDDWMDERRKYERRLHVAENRLKTVLDEVAAYQASPANGGTNTTSNEHDTDGVDSGAENDAASVRTMSMSNSVRLSLLNGAILQPGNSLADELRFEDDDQTDADGPGSVLSSPTSPKHARSSSRDSSFGRLHPRNQSIESGSRPGSVARSRLFMIPAVLEALEGEDEEENAAEASPVVKACYTDNGTQYSPPPSPRVLPKSKSTTPELSGQRMKTPESEGPARVDGEIEANQRKKRVQPNQPLIIEPPKPDHKMISRSAQTVEIPLSPLRTPNTPLPETDTPEPAPTPMVTASTQTDEPALASTGAGVSTLRAPPSLPPIQIPTINIQPPTSCPNTPREPRLPQHFKHFGCQVNLSSTVSTSHVSVQTEGIQVDKRIALLPMHLHPSNISSRPTSPAPCAVALDPENDHPSSVPPRNPRRLVDSCEMSDLASSPLASQEDGDSFLGPVHDQPSSSRRASRRTHRLSAMFSGFDTASSDEEDGFADADVSDSEYRTALSAPKPQSTFTRATKRESFGTAAVKPEQEKPRLAAGAGADADASRDCDKSQAPTPPPNGTSTANRTGAIRKAAMIQSGLASHQKTRCRSPDLSDGKSPPFPIPTRASSRRSQTDLNTPSDGRESPTRGQSWHRRETSRSSNQSPSIRKARSVAALPRGSRFRRHGSRSPPPLSPSTEEAPESPGLPPLPRNDITTPRAARIGGQPSYRGHRHNLSINTTYTANTHNTALTGDSAASQTVGVVEAIAQAMVGEWMLKYVRRRKSFSVAESTGKDDSSNDRHKRWVWLAPYERSILWSSRQPSSGSALLGKTGRKLTIQSVLDVKDDNAAPKVMPAVFNRSILILTPQRALKFTTGSAERHYLWLTALSFLAHSSQAVPENIPAPPLPKMAKQQPLPVEFAPPQRRMKRGGIRDSIRLAKGKSSMAKIGSSNMSSVVSVPSSSRRNETIGFGAADAYSALSGGYSCEQSRDAAEPPFVPRFSERGANAVATHARKRSNTGGHMAPPLSYRGFSGPAGATTAGGPPHSEQGTCNDSVDTAALSDACQTHGLTNTTWNLGQTVSGRASEASLRRGNFFDAIGTVRMEAFISPLAYSQNDEAPSLGGRRDFRRSVRRRRSKEIRRRNSRSRHREVYGHGRSARARDDYGNRGKYVAEEDFFARDDPFKGF